MILLEWNFDGLACPATIKSLQVLVNKEWVYGKEKIMRYFNLLSYVGETPVEVLI